MDIIYPSISEDENTALVQAIPLITLYVASADGQINIEEADWAKRLTEIRSFKHDDKLGDYYMHVSATFEHELNELIRHMPPSKEERLAYFGDKLAQLDPILQKMDAHESYKLYKEFLSFALHVAKSSGGILHIGTVSPAEKAIIGLPMLTPILDYPGI